MKPTFLFAGAVVAAATVVTLVRSGATAPSPPPVSYRAATGAAERALTRESALPIVVYVAGEVVRPGIYTFSSGARAERALHAAGGPTRRADMIAVNLAELLHDGEELVVPPLGVADAPAGNADFSTGAGGPHGKRHAHGKRHRRHGRGSSHQAKAPDASVDLNSASEAQFESLPGIGAGLAARIVAFRELNGPFQAIDDLRDVGGMTERKVELLAPYLTLR